jgi:hypothetical protein
MAEMATTKRTAAPKKAAAGKAAPKQNILVLDVGGTNLKVIDSNHAEPIKIPSGLEMTAQRMVEETKNATQGWGYTAPKLTDSGRSGLNVINWIYFWLPWKLPFEALFSQPIWHGRSWGNGAKIRVRLSTWRR